MTRLAALITITMFAVAGTVLSGAKRCSFALLATALAVGSAESTSPLSPLPNGKLFDIW